MRFHTKLHGMTKKIALSGGTGFIGQKLKAHLEAKGYDIISLSRCEGHKQYVWWPTPDNNTKDALKDVTHVIHLAGENIAGKPWTKGRKETLMQNRSGLARHLSDMCHDMPKLEHVIVGSAIGYYGTKGQGLCTEDTESGTDFSAALCQAIEHNINLPQHVKLTFARSGVVLAAHGGALKKMLPSFNVCLGGRMGHGTQPFPWISLTDEVRAFEHIITHALEGPVNLTSPTTETQHSFAKALGRALSRPTRMYTPAWLLKLILRDMADELLLNGRHVAPQKLTKTGFKFKHPTLKDALRDILSNQ